MAKMLTPRSFTFFAGYDRLSRSADTLFRDFFQYAERMSSLYVAPRTLRVTLPALDLDTSEDFDVDIALRQRWCDRAHKAGFRWVNLPLVISSHQMPEPEKIYIVSDLLSRHEGLFSSIQVSATQNISVSSAAYAKICRSLSARDYRGFANFRFGAGYNIKEYTPFFPFSWGTETAVSVALESLPVVRSAWNEFRNLDEIKSRLAQELKQAEGSFRKVLEGSDIHYGGADWSLAPLPNGSETVAGLVEAVSGNPIGSSGSIDGISKLTSCLKAMQDEGITATGFNGVMLSVLEDDVLANRFRHRNVSINDLLLYSTVCGCGLDMVPIAGDVPEVCISEYATDTGVLAFRLNKPLGVRFLPIAQLKAGQETTFSHDFVCNSAVVSL